MSNKFDEMTQAVNEARTTMQAANSVADSMARMLEGRLRHVNHSTLRELKKELADYNMHTGVWKGNR